MPEDKNFSASNNNKNEVSPSALFLEMMRQAAARREETETDEASDAYVEDETPQEEPIETSSSPLFIETSPIDIPKQDKPADTNGHDAVYVSESDIFGESTDYDETVKPSDLTSSVPFEDDSGVTGSDTIEEAQVPETDATAQKSLTGSRIPIYTAPKDAPAGDSDQESKLEAQRIRRLRRRQERRQRRRVGILGGFLRTSIITVIAAVLASTVFTWFTNPDFITPSVVTGLQVAQSTSVYADLPQTPTVNAVTPNYLRRIGIVSGHRGPENDPGAVCPDGLTETEINFAVAQLVVRDLRERGYSVDLLDEFDPRLQGYRAAALLSIHSNDCGEYNGEFVSGYLIARAEVRPAGGLDDILAECVARDYEEMAQIQRRYTLTDDMTLYHTFGEISALTPAAILELGFMRDDRDMLVNRQEDLATGIVNGILCFLNGENPIADANVTPDPIGITPEPLVATEAP